MEIFLVGSEWQEQVDPTTPAPGRVRLYAKAKKMYIKDSDGTVTDLAQSGGGAGASKSFGFFAS
jgi:hypothetical protein